MKRKTSTSLNATNRSGVASALEQARLAYTKAEGGHRKALDQAVMTSIDKAEEIENDDRKWSEFQQNDRWTTRKSKPRMTVEALFFSLLWILEDRKQASKIHKAIRPLYRDPLLSSADIVKQVRANGGYEKLANTSRRKAATSKKICIELADSSEHYRQVGFPFEMRISIVGARGHRLFGKQLGR